MCNIIPGFHWHNTATAILNNEEIQIPHNKRHKLPAGNRFKEEKRRPITFYRRETVLKVIFVAKDTRQRDGTNDPYYQQLRKAIFNGKL